MKKKITLFLLILIIIVVIRAVVNKTLNDNTLPYHLTNIQPDEADQSAFEPVYRRISPEDAIGIISGEEAYILLDVRTISEFSDGHILGAVLIPNFEIAVRAEIELPDKNALIIVYCQSGLRSFGAVTELINMGYTNVFDLGGIIDWPYETVRETTGSLPLDMFFKPLGELSAEDIALPYIVNDMQEFTIYISSEGFVPRVLVAEIGMNILINFLVDDSIVILDGEDYLVYIPEHRGVVNLAEKMQTPIFMPNGSFSIENETGSIRTFVSVVEDINNFDADKIISEAKEYIAEDIV